MGQEDMERERKGELGSSAGHGFGSGLCHLAPLEGSRHGTMEDAGGPWGFSGPLSPWGTESPLSQGPSPMGDSREAENGCGGEGSWAESAPPPRIKPPSGWASDGGGGGVVKAGVQCGHEGHAQSPRVCVRA